MEQHGKNETLCRVCGDKASGKHYGVPSCDGCRGFFKRSIRRNLDYVCKENGRCIVDVTRRNQCQACRFNKCLQVNMKKDAVQHERAPRNSLSSHHHHHHYTGGGTLPLRTRGTTPLYHPSLLEPALCTGLSGSMQAPICPTLQPAAAVAAAAYLQQQLLQNYAAPFKTTNNTAVPSFVAPPTIGLHFQLQSLGSPPLSPTGIHNGHHLSQRPPQQITPTQPPPPSGAKEDEVTSSEEAKPFPELEQDQNNDVGSYRTCSERTITSPAPSVSNNSTLRPIDLACLTLAPAENIYESAAKLLFLAVKWARSIPSFLQLAFQDQSILLEEAWSELFVLSAAQWALPVDEEYLVAGAVAPVSRHVALSEDARKLRDIIARFALLRVDHTEFACLKALVLFKAEVRGLRETVQVELLQDQTHVMLNEYCAVRHKARFGKLLLLLPAVGGLSRQSLEELFFRKTVGDVPIERLLGDMVKSTSISVTSLNHV